MRRRGIVFTTAAVTALGAAGAAFVLADGRGEAETRETAAPPATTQVTRQDLRDTEKVDADLGYGPATSLVSRLPGTVTGLPLAGSVIAQGQALYEVDSRPVVLMYGAKPAYRPLGPGDEGADVKQLETALNTLGYKGFTVDDSYTESTAEAVERWQEDLGLPETGRVELGRVAFLPESARIETVSAQLGQPVQPGQTVLTHTGTTRLVTARLDLADQRIAAVGTPLKIEMPDGKRVDGKVEQVYTVIEAPTGQGQEAQTKLEVIISLADPAVAEGLDVATVDAVFTVAERKQVLAVPVAALVALAEGGYGVEVVEGAATRYVRVETGMYAEGKVEITGAGIAEGTVVGMPK